jgi:Tol biopolymer transport system component
MNLRTVVAAACGILASHSLAGQTIVTTVNQGTNMAVALAPDGQTLVVDLMGQLWSLPASGGGAELLLATQEVARNPRFSPDGRQLVYQQYSRGQWDLWLLELQTLTRRRLTGPPDDERDPDFASAGTEIVFVSNQSGSDELYRMALPTGAPIRLTWDGGLISWPSVSEREEIAYIEQRAGEWALMLKGRQGPPQRLYASSNPLQAPSWRPGGGVILFTEQQSPAASDLRMILLADDPILRTLTRGEDVFGFRAAWKSPAEFVYTADGRIFSRTLANATRYPVPLFAGVAVHPAPRGLKTVIPRAPDPNVVMGIRSRSVAPSNRLTAFTALGDLWLENRRGGLTQLTDDAFVDIDPVFSPDEDRVIFASDRGGTLELWSVDLATRALEQLTRGPGKAYGPAIAPDGRRVAFLSTDGFGPWAPAELKILNLADREPPRTVARGFRDAQDLHWHETGDGLSIRARDPAAGPGFTEQRAQYSLDLATNLGTWDRAAPTLAEDTDPATRPTGTELTWTPPVADAHYVIQVDRLFDGIGTEYRRHMDIHIEGRRITAVVARGLLPLPDTVLDARSYTVIPGLIDLHAHQSSLAGERLGRIWLSYGVTTVREVASARDDGLERKEAWVSGRRLGPRLLLGARHNVTSGWPAVASGRPAFDVLELYRDQAPQLRHGLLQVAAQFGIPIFAEDLVPPAPFGINGIEHIGGRTSSIYDLERSSVSRTYADILSLLAASGTTVTPTLAAFGGLGALPARRPAWSEDRAYRQLYSPAERTAWQAWVRTPMTPALAGMQATLAALVRTGGRVAVGSDAPSVPYGLGLHAELSLLSRAGLPADHVLRLATAEAALALGLERDLGTVEAGKLADLVVIDGNPLNNMADTLNVVAVVRDGFWYDRDVLLEAP